MSLFPANVCTLVWTKFRHLVQHLGVYFVFFGWLVANFWVYLDTVRVYLDNLWANSDNICVNIGNILGFLTSILEFKWYCLVNVLLGLVNLAESCFSVLCIYVFFILPCCFSSYGWWNYTSHPGLKTNHAGYCRIADTYESFNCSRF